MLSVREMKIKRFVVCLAVCCGVLMVTAKNNYVALMSEISMQYNSLSFAEKWEYKRITQEVEKSDTFKIEMRYGLHEDDYAYLFDILVNEDARYFYISSMRYLVNGNTLSVEYYLILDEETIAEYTEQLNETVEKIVAETAGLSESARFERYFEYVSSAEYKRSGGITATAAGCLVEKRANCQGYAKAMRLLCVRSGIPCVLVSGSHGSVAHMWNQVCIENVWYYCDATDGDTEERLMLELPDEYTIELLPDTYNTV